MKRKKKGKKEPRPRPSPCHKGHNTSAPASQQKLARPRLHVRIRSGLSLADILPLPPADEKRKKNYLGLAPFLPNNIHETTSSKDFKAPDQTKIEKSMKKKQTKSNFHDLAHDWLEAKTIFIKTITDALSPIF